MAYHNPTQGNKINDDMDQLVLKSFNTALHRQAQEWSKRSNQADTLAEVNLMNEINSVNVRLWKMIWMLTSPVHGQEMSVNPTPISEATSRSRHLPCQFLLASLAHTTFPQCNFPLHLPLSDFVDSHSGSSDLLQLMSRFGVCSSRDTLQRLKTAVVARRKDDGLQKELVTGAFCVTSVDNIDRQAPGKITVANQERGFHGTSVQHVAPRPTTSRITPEEVPQDPCSSAPLPGLFSSAHTAGTTSSRIPARTAR